MNTDIAPAGAANGSWINGRQVWNGKLGAPNVIINPSQVGYGQEVSQEVVQQTNPNNVAFLQKQGATVPKNNQPSAPTPGFGATATPTTPTIDLQGLYNTYSKDAGIADLEGKITTKTQAYNDATSKINDNPYLSEADRVGRAEKLRMDYNNDIKVDQDALAMKQADVKLKLDLASKQFDINSKAATQEFERFNSLLSSGALNNAGGQDIANLALSTGLSTDMIQSAIKANKTKGSEMVKYDDGTNQGFAIVDKEGNIVKKEIIAGSKSISDNLSSNDQITEATKAINDYMKSKEAQKAASPEDFIKLILTKYPLAKGKITDSQGIRNITKQ